MKHVKTIARVEPLAGIRVFYCAACKHPEMQVLREAA
jgi:hypothetical protein